MCIYHTQLERKINMAKEKKKSKIGSHIASISFFTLMGMVLGFAMVSFLEWQLPEGIGSSEKAYRMCAMLVFCIWPGSCIS